MGGLSMARILIKILDKEGNLLRKNEGEDAVSLLYDVEYKEGDTIVLETNPSNIHVVWQVDDALGCSTCYVTGPVTYQVPFEEKKKVYSPKAFSGSKHYMYARVAEKEEVITYRNLSVNVNDQHDTVNCYPHASANVETRGESVFAARNAIDGIAENHGHGMWPYASWGINRDPNAEMKLDFGRKVCVDCLKVVLRADFPHDSWWTHATVTFSDGSVEKLNFIKTDKAQTFHISSREVEWLTFGTLIKAEDESPFPALSQLEVYGRDVE
jgi:hypothetical protein